MNTFTPGPWHVQGQHQIKVVGPHGANSVAPVAATDVSPFCRPEAEQQANARLIAAAPEMFDTLNQVVAILTQPVQYTKIRNGASCDVLRADCLMAVRSAQAAITKAKGE